MRYCKKLNKQQYHEGDMKIWIASSNNNSGYLLSTELTNPEVMGTLRHK